MPPPNITGKLHMGHAMFATLQDILIRHHRMKGCDTLWLPGCDHAGLATQAKLDEAMRSEGLDPEGPGMVELLHQDILLNDNGFSVTNRVHDNRPASRTPRH